jgi:NADH-ubiquinone oxidoreductase chain 5
MLIKSFHMLALYILKLLWTILTLILITTSYIIYRNKVIVIEWNLIFFLNTNLIFTLIIDPLGITFSRVVIIISANVISFSSVYIINDKFINRFTILVLLFIISINLLIFVPHIIILLLGWDGLGLVSFILVIYYQNHKSLAAGIITVLSNRIGDSALLLAIALTINQGHWFIINIDQRSFLTKQIILITLAAITKRAQVPFSRWLPAAIAAPTPVSALVHSSTLVTAGVFLLIRFYPFLHSLQYFNTSLLLIASITTLLASIRATIEHDLKKIIALSTLRQLGLIMYRLALNLPTLTFFHIITHALFKALLFISAGSFINYHLHSQDLRWIGNLNTQIPISTSCASIANLALCGFPFTAGFYSKDSIIEIAASSTTNTATLSIIFLRIGLTSFYSIRLSIISILSPTQTNPWITIHEKNNINTPLLILSTIATVSGTILIWLNPVRNNVTTLPLHLKILPYIFIISGLVLGFFITKIDKYIFPIQNSINHYARCTIWFTAPLSTQFILNYPIKLAHLNLKIIDHGWAEIPQLIYQFITQSNTTIINHSPIHAPQIQQ